MLFRSNKKPPMDPPPAFEEPEKPADKVIEGETVDKPYESPSGRNVETHGIDDPCDDKNCIIHGIS